MTQYFVDLKGLAHEKISFEGSFEPGMVDFASDNVRQVGLLDWSASADRAGGEIRINGSLKVTLEQMCSRCLAPARCENNKPFDLFFKQRDEQMFDEDEEVELSEEETRNGVFTGTRLAVGGNLHELMLLGPS